MSDKRFTAADVGCYLDGHFGWHNTYRVVELAQQHGFTLNPDDQRVIDDYARGGLDATESTLEISDEATDYLRSITDEGLDWQWDMGELSLVPVDEDGQEIYS